ncbi:PhoH family protein [Vibrio chagasii]|nr:PhoH family protein [Vibrio chagasii]
MRGRTLNDAFIILDESQNTTVGADEDVPNSYWLQLVQVITGDTTQIDLPRGAKSGLRHATEVLAEVDDISFNFFMSEDVVRHPVVARIVNAFLLRMWEAKDQKERKEFEKRKREEREAKSSELSNLVTHN